MAYQPALGTLRGDNKMDNKLFVLSGPSGAGISEIVAGIFAARNDVGTVIPVTARKMKAGEVDGVGFFFYDLDGWNALKESGDLLEATEFAGNDYGTSRRLVTEQLNAGKHVILTLSPDRAKQLKQNMPEAVCVYVSPTDGVLRERYGKISRSAFELSVRMEEAQKQSALADFCDCRIDSDDIAAAVKALSALMD